MFEHLKAFDVVLVSGPQRSGTTICAEMICQDTGHAYVHESEYQFHDEAAFRAVVSAGGGIVIHCPPMCHLLHEFAEDESVAVVFMYRDLVDIIASQERIDWTVKEEWRELAKYNADEGPIAQIKYDYWENEQRGLFPLGRYFEIDYESLSDHPLWKEPGDRAYYRFKR